MTTSKKKWASPWLAVALPDLRKTLPRASAAARNGETPLTTLKSESELRNAMLDRLIAASLSENKPAREATLAQWRTIAARKAKPASGAPKAG